MVLRSLLGAFDDKVKNIEISEEKASTVFPDIKDFKGHKSSAGNPKFGETRWVKKMDRHCNALIGKAKVLAEEFQKFADWHGMRAAELEGK